MEKIEHYKEVHINQPFFYSWILAKKYDFNPIRRIFHEKNDPNSLDFEIFFSTKLSNYYH